MSNSWAADFGDVQLRSYLGQAFSAQLTVSGTSQNLVEPNCYKSKVEALDGSLLAVPRIALGKARADGQSAQLLFTSRELINEPAVKFKVEMICDGVRQREYALLLDYAELATPAASANAAASVADMAKDNANTNGVTSTPLPAQAPKQSRFKPKVLRLSTPDQAEKTETHPKKAPAPSRFSMELTPPKDALRISNQDIATDSTSSKPGKQTPATLEQQRQLENKAAQEAFAKMLRDEPVPATNPDDLKKEFQKVQSLENEVTHLKLDLEVKTQHEQSVATWLIVLNVVVMLLFLVVIGVLIYMLKKARHIDKGSWWGAADQAGNSKFDKIEQIETTDYGHNAVNQVSITSPESQPRKSLAAVQDEAIADYLSSLLPGEASSDDTLDAVKSENMGGVKHASTASNKPAIKSAEKFNLFANRDIHSIHIEEVSDAMQEAEFWMSINDPGRAIEILEPHCMDEHPETPVMWLCLLELYRTVGNEEKYEALRQRFRANFNTNILPFNEKVDPASIKHLEDFEHLIAKCCTFWHTSYMLPFLESLLVNDRNEERVGFDLSVYQDILLLIGVCKELSRPEEASAMSA